MQASPHHTTYNTDEKRQTQEATRPALPHRPGCSTPHSRHRGCLPGTANTGSGPGNGRAHPVSPAQGTARKGGGDRYRIGSLPQGEYAAAGRKHPRGRFPAYAFGPGVRWPALRTHGQLPIQHIKSDILPHAGVPRPYPLLHRHDTARGGTAYGGRPGKPHLRHPERTAAGLVQRGVSVHSR